MKNWLFYVFLALNIPSFVAASDVLATGDDHIIILDDKGDLWGFGKNTEGQLGLKDNQNRVAPEKVLLPKEASFISSIVLKGRSTFLLDGDGQVWVCGNNLSGQLGLREVKNQNSFSMMGFPQSDVVICFVSAGSDFTVFLDKKGEVWTCGCNMHGQLGRHFHEKIELPQKVTIPKNVTIKYVATGSGFTVLIDQDGQVYSFGNNYCGQLGLGHTIKQNTPQTVSMPQKAFPIRFAAAGAEHTILVDEQDQLWGCGSNWHGQLGLGHQDGQQNFQEIFLPKRESVASVSAGTHHTVALFQDQEVWSCGVNHSGQLGHFNTGYQVSFERVSLPQGALGIRAIKAADFQTILLDEGGQVWVCGKNELVPRDLALPPPFRKMALPFEVMPPVCSNNIKSAASCNF